MRDRLFRFLIVILLSCGLTYGDTPAERFEFLRTSASDALSNGEYEKAVKVLIEQCGLAPLNPLPRYNLACAQALEGNPGKALESLGMAVEVGWHDAEHTRSDSDLSTLREEPRFNDLLGAMERSAILWENRSNPAHRILDPSLAPAFPSLDSLTAHFDSRLNALRNEQFLYGRDGYSDREWKLRDERAAALRRFVAEHGDDSAADDAGFELVETMIGYHDRWIWDTWGEDGVAARETAEWFLETFPASKHIPAVSLRRAMAVWFSREVPRDEDAPVHDYFPPETVAVVDSLLKEVGDTYPGSEAAAEALIQRLVISSHSSGGEITPHVMDLYDTLIHSYGDNPAVLNAAREQARGVMMTMEGFAGFSGIDLEGNTVNNELLKGSVVLIDFWATWCGPCIREIPGLAEAYESLKPHGFEIIGVSLDRGTSESFTTWLNNNRVTWPQIFSGDGWNAPLARQFHVRSIPCTVLLNRNGKVIAVDKRGEELVETIRQELGLTG